jgi:hypothetical protein
MVKLYYKLFYYFDWGDEINTFYYVCGLLLKDLKEIFSISECLVRLNL